MLCPGLPLACLGFRLVVMLGSGCDLGGSGLLLVRGLCLRLSALLPSVVLLCFAACPTSSCVRLSATALPLQAKSLSTTELRSVRFRPRRPRCLGRLCTISPPEARNLFSSSGTRRRGLVFRKLLTDLPGLHGLFSSFATVTLSSRLYMLEAVHGYRIGDHRGLRGQSRSSITVS